MGRFVSLLAVLAVKKQDTSVARMSFTFFFRGDFGEEALANAPLSRSQTPPGAPRWPADTEVSLLMCRSVEDRAFAVRCHRALRAPSERIHLLSKPQRLSVDVYVCSKRSSEEELTEELEAPEEELEAAERAPEEELEAVSAAAA